MIDSFFYFHVHSPMPLWLTTGRPHHDPPTPVGVLTEAEFNSLPEIIYQGTPEKDDSDTDSKEQADEEEADTTNELSATDVKSGTEDNYVTGSGSTASQGDIEAGVSERGTRADEDEVSIENVSLDTAKPETQGDEGESAVKNISLEEMDDDDFLKGNEDSAEERPDHASTHGDFLETGDIDVDHDKEAEVENFQVVSSHPEKEERPAAANEMETEKTVVIERKQAAAHSVTTPVDDTTLDQVPAEQAACSTDEAAEETVTTTNVDPPANDTQNGGPLPESSPVGCGSTAQTEGENQTQDERQTTSTACAICIDEFETGERLTLLPKCKHAFHRECIHAWLIERQGCCPLCKTDVLDRNQNILAGELDIEAPAEQRFMMSSM